MVSPDPGGPNLYNLTDCVGRLKKEPEASDSTVKPCYDASSRFSLSLISFSFGLLQAPSSQSRTFRIGTE